MYQSFLPSQCVWKKVHLGHNFRHDEDELAMEKEEEVLKGDQRHLLHFLQQTEPASADFTRKSISHNQISQITLAAQQSAPKDIDDLSMSDIATFMKNHFNSRRFIVWERFKFWLEMQCKPGESIQELVARIRQDIAKCIFSSIWDLQDEEMLKALFKIPDD
ncbi:hypothetical protein J437_LFUL016151 [Ladona fulva]|uniref:Uncharacterized protein n=1 Tax=Ladona fulva TaxID=123851 RepID=A0A8K0KKI7_LADFU|nr:hypothetical protein J437_LFUL016151 [Ladona fulva]